MACWFNGFLPLDPFVVWSPARLKDEARAGWLAQLRARLAGVFDEPPIQLPPLADFPQFGLDSKKRFLAITTIGAETRTREAPDLASSQAALDAMVKSGFILEQAFTPPGAQPLRGFLTVRAESREAVEARLSSLPTSWEFEIHEIGFDVRQL